MLVTLQINPLCVGSKFLGMRVKPTPEGEYTLDQEAMIDGLLNKFGLQDDGFIYHLHVRVRHVAVPGRNSPM
ncbi:hypothetical protein PR003_g17353 [Phytophthora rubi]|uniref:Uncharacterized protein n=1 Tax=Phytophthora rubi TaxID=129364 RepID=A0A6A3JYJ8_9STRA|nr:hypothetical protein PR002_g18309 [Phytophthora rubi]KAE9321923.1 hypothetical protein PR003_g17353 [Phytophthora rubi]